MIDKVIILGIRRGGEILPSGEIQQMAGRCGRSYTRSGEVALVVPESDSATACEYLRSAPEPTASRLDDAENVAFHCIPEIYHGTVSDEDSYRRWYARTLAHAQGASVPWRDVGGCLAENGCIVAGSGGKVELTALGEASYRFYYTPRRLHMLKNKLLIVRAEKLLEDDYALSWLLASRRHSIHAADTEALSAYAGETTARNLRFMHGELIDGYVFHCLLTRRRPGFLRSIIADTGKDLGRLFGALRHIALHFCPDTADAVETWRICFSRRLPCALGKIAAEFEGASNALISELNHLGVHTAEELKRMRHIIEQHGSASLRNFMHGRGL